MVNGRVGTRPPTQIPGVPEGTPFTPPQPREAPQDAKGEALLTTTENQLAKATRDLARANERFRTKFSKADAGTRDILSKTQNTLNARQKALEQVVSRIRGGERFTSTEINKFISGRESRIGVRLEAERVRGKAIERLQVRLGAPTKQVALAEQRAAEQRLKGILGGRPPSELTVKQAQQLTARQKVVLGVTVTERVTEKILPVTLPFVKRQALRDTTIGGTPSFFKRLKEGRPVKAITEFTGVIPSKIEEATRRRDTPAKVKAREKLQKRFGVADPGFTTKAQRDAATKSIAEVAPFFTPVVGQFLFAGSVIESLATKSGRGEIGEFRDGLQEQGLTKKQATLATTALLIGEATLAGAALKVRPPKIQIKPGQSLTTVKGASREQVKTALAAQDKVIAGVQKRKLTANRVYETRAGDDKVILIEFSKLKKSQVKNIAKDLKLQIDPSKFEGQRFVTGVQIGKDGKIKRSFAGLSIEQAGKDESRIITKLVSKGKTGKPIQLEFAETVRTVGGKRIPGGDISISRGQTIFKGASKVGKSPLFTKADIQRLKAPDFVKGERVGAKAIEESVSIIARKPIKIFAKKVTDPFKKVQKKDIRRVEGGVAISVVKPFAKAKKKLPSLLGKAKPLKPITFGLPPTAAKIALQKVAVRKAIAPPKIITAPGKTLGGSVALAQKPKPLIKTKLKKVELREVRPSGVSGLLARQKTIARGRLRVSPSLATIASARLNQRLLQAPAQNAVERQIETIKTKIVQVNQTKLSTQQRTQLRQKLNTQLKTALKQRVSTTIPQVPKARTPRILLPPLFKNGKKVKAKPGPLAPKTRQGYNVFGKPQGRRKFMKLNRVPLTKSNAKSLGAFLSDTSLAAQFRLRKTSKPAQRRKLRPPLQYFQRNRLKFRETKIRKGKVIKTPNQFIERRKHRIDTAGEKRRITLARRLKQLERRSFAKKIKPLIGVKK